MFLFISGLLELIDKIEVLPNSMEISVWLIQGFGFMVGHKLEIMSAAYSN
jgi:hypothetical protein